MEYTIIDGAVNLAMRLENEAPPGSVRISCETYAHLREEIRCEERGCIQVKRITYPVATYEAVALQQDLAAARP